MKIIRVSGCHDCPWTIFGDADSEDQYLGCQFILEDDNPKDVFDCIKAKTCLVDCPLEDVQGIIRKI